MATQSAGPVADADLLLDEYSDVFLMPAAGEVAIIEYERSEQREAESMACWHARLCTLYWQANQNAANAAIEVDPHIRRWFVHCLRDKTVM